MSWNRGGWEGTSFDGHSRSTLLLFLIATLGWVCGPTSVNQDAGEERPHILLILVDDMGYGDLGVYNRDSRIPTPRIDTLAREGMRFTDAHAPGAVCHPSRYGLLTGRYPFRTNTSIWRAQPVIEESRVTLASLLQSHDYRTAMVGKWHLGFDESRGYEAPLRGGPVDRGFDTFFGIRASTDIPPYFYIRNDQAVTPPTDHIEANSSTGWSPIQVSSRGLRAIQDQRWKLIDGLGSGGFRNPRSDPLAPTSGPENSNPDLEESDPERPEGQLYDLQADPAETKNLWHEHPEAVERLRSLLEEIDHSGRSR